MKRVDLTSHELMGIATVASFGLLYFLLFKEIPKENIQVFVFLAGMLLGFFFGSSINKQRSPETLPAPPAPPAPITPPPGEKKTEEEK